MTLREWLPTAGEVAADLAHVPELPAEYDAWTAPWRGYELHFYSLERVRFFNGFAWSRASARAWHLPLGAVAAYALMIPLLRRVRRRVELRAFAQCWNFGLALFSAMGFCACAPVLLTELYRNGFYFTCCAPAPWYGGGVCGLFVALFIYSKFAELAPPRRPDEARAFFAARSRAQVDTALILLAKRRLIFLHWWHHATVLLYCWHSYGTQIATGLWFATMNYFVHALMYAYYGCMGVERLRPRVKKRAIFVTLLQLAQMVVGIGVTVRAVLYQIEGEECSVNKTNSILGLAMYSSYFVLFGLFFVDTYVRSSSNAKRA